MENLNTILADYTLFVADTNKCRGDIAKEVTLLGLLGELGEYIGSDDSVSELGDVLWYVVALCNTRGIPLPYLSETPSNNRPPLEELIIALGELCEKLKKNLTYEGIQGEYGKFSLDSVQLSVSYVLKSLHRIHPLDLLIEVNIKKLSERKIKGSLLNDKLRND